MIKLLTKVSTKQELVVEFRKFIPTVRNNYDCSNVTCKHEIPACPFGTRLELDREASGNCCSGQQGVFECKPIANANEDKEYDGLYTSCGFLGWNKTLATHKDIVNATKEP